jgi:hypothetical protein
MNKRKWRRKRIRKNRTRRRKKSMMKRWRRRGGGGGGGGGDDDGVCVSPVGLISAAAELGGPRSMLAPPSWADL